MSDVVLPLRAVVIIAGCSVLIGACLAYLAGYLAIWWATRADQKRHERVLSQRFRVIDGGSR